MFALAFVLYWLLLLGFAAWAFAKLFLLGADLSRYDLPAGSVAGAREDSGAARDTVLARIATMRADTFAAPVAQRLATARRLADQGFAGTPSNPQVLGVEVVPVDAGGVAGEWVLAPGADPMRRLLYLHGGAFTLGSPASHRALTAALSRAAGVAVLAVDYRLMPEHPRRASIADSRSAWRWLLEHGPSAAGAPRDAYLAGDSAGGNLALALLAWIRDQRLRAPDAAVALSPATDSTLQSPSLRRNAASDVLLGPSIGRLARLPRSAVAWLTWIGNRVRPRAPLISPLRGPLHDLPPTLVLASTSEMLLDDARRYVNKARAAGSPAELALWPDMVHVWPLFVDVLPEAGDAVAHIAAFLSAHRTAD